MGVVPYEGVVDPVLAFYVITWTKVWEKAWDITTAEATVKPYPSQATEVTHFSHIGFINNEKLIH